VGSDGHQSVKHDCSNDAANASKTEPRITVENNVFFQMAHMQKWSFVKEKDIK